MRNETIPRTAILAAIVVLMACRSKTPSGQTTMDEAEEIEKPAPETASVESPVSGDDPEKQCGGTMAKDAASERGRLAALEEPFLESKRSELMISHIEALREAASSRDLQKISGIVSDTYSRMPPLVPETNATHEKLLSATAAVRIHGYATCMSIAEDDPGWCDGIDDHYSGGPDTCRLVFTIYRRIANDAYIQKKSCAEAMEAGPEIRGIGKEALVAGCQAITEFDAQKCPFSPNTKMAALCSGLADRSGLTGCGSQDDQDEKWTECCRKLSYHLGLAMNGNSHPRFSPETGALGGDAGGCDRALAWGLFEDLGPLFGIVGMTPALYEKYGPGDYTCSYEVQWTTQAVPGEAVAK
jgi:hypothetical protein